MKVGALRGTLRYWSQPYGVQQLRELYNARKGDKGIPSAQFYWAFAKGKLLGE